MPDLKKYTDDIKHLYSSIYALTEYANVRDGLLRGHQELIDAREADNLAYISELAENAADTARLAG